MSSLKNISDTVTENRHGIRQLQSGWADGPAYITQCPIKTGQSYVYNFTIVGQRGTLWWHAHFSWLRATLYGPIIILPKLGDFYPFPKPHKEIPIMFGTIQIYQQTVTKFTVHFYSIYMIFDLNIENFHKLQVSGGMLIQKQLSLRLFRLVLVLMSLMHTP